MFKAPIYFPAVSHAPSNGLSKDTINSKFLKKSIRFYSKLENGYYHHPFVLFSAAHHYHIPDLRVSHGIDLDAKIMIDSGGFQLATGAISEEKWNNRLALDWSEKNGNIFPILDRPNRGRQTFHENLQKTVESAKFYSENRSNSNSHILNVISSNLFSEVEYWYSKVSPFNLDGWAHGGHRHNFKTILKSFLMLRDKGEFNKDKMAYHHIFGVSSPELMIYASMMQYMANKQNLNVQITYDSSSPMQAATYGHYYTSFDYTGVSNIKLSNRLLLDSMDESIKLPCGCEICRELPSIKTLLSEETSTNIALWMSFHNLRIQLLAKNNFDSFVHLGDDLEVFKFFPSKIRNNLEGIKKIFEAYGPTTIKLVDHLIDYSDTDDLDHGDLSGFF